MSTCSSAWHLLQGLCTVERQVIAWFEVDDPERFCRFPISIITDDLGEYYIFPPFDHPGLKVGWGAVCLPSVSAVDAPCNNYVVGGHWVEWPDLSDSWLSTLSVI
jgi:hypothetical protein